MNTEIKRKFYHSLKRGTGEAYLIARDNPTVTNLTCAAKFRKEK